MPLMAAMNVAFGIAAAYTNGYLIPTVAPHYLQGNYGGYLAALTAAVAAMISIPTTLGIIKAEWKKYYMFFGPLGFGLVTNKCLVD